jgi:hypothetical protein
MVVIDLHLSKSLQPKDKLQRLQFGQDTINALNSAAHNVQVPLSARSELFGRQLQL